MEAFESFVALTMEADTEDGRLVVSEAIKFPVIRQTAKTSRVEIQTHGFEVDLVGARHDRLVLATVKSFFGSRGVVAEHVMGKSETKRFNSLYALINDPVVRDAVIDGASKRYGYPINQIELRLYVGKFAGGKTVEHERLIREWAAKQIVGAGPIRVFGLQDIVATARQVASSKTYRDNPALVAMKVMDAAGMLTPNESRPL
ncbi:hypothetical protein ACFWN2_20825 [Lentzea sp. NPDC058436]|uniref:hypothetical protein n=1 Tax=Lentzea sp. NPDC058436 TaxID=3346499 RepID=UPI003652F5C3